MKSYPKVPRYNHDSVNEDFYDSEDLVLLEKLDGGNFRFILYDERYEDTYTEEIYEYNPSHKDVFFGTSNLIRGRISDPIESFDGNFARILKYLRDNLGVEQLVSLHDEYKSPLMFFGEHMVRHTLDYEYDYNPPPAFLGFDVFKMDQYTEELPANIFDERFDGFLDIESAFDAFEQLGLDTVPVVDKVDSGFDITEYEVPISEYRNGQAEGVVMRSDSLNRRVKYRTEEFKERNKKAWGMNESDADSGAELFVARYITNPRIRKHIHKKSVKGENIQINEITNSVVADAWEEEWVEISEINIPIKTGEIYKQATERCETVFQTMKDNAKLNDSNLENLWADTVDSMGDVDVSTGFDIDENRMDDLVEAVDSHSTVESGLARTLVPPVPIHNAAETVAEEQNRNVGRWAIEPTFDTVEAKLWLENLEYIATFPKEFIPNKVSSELLNYVKEELELRDDVDIDEKPDDWKPDIENTDTDGFKNLFE